MNVKITFNGKQFSSTDDMPPDVRAAYDRAMAALKGGNIGGIKPTVNVSFKTNVKFVHEGKTYSSLDEMPPEVRGKYQAAIQTIDKDSDGIPDFLESGVPSATGEGLPTPSTIEQSTFPVTDQPPVISSDWPTPRLWLAIGVVGMLVILMVLLLLLVRF